MVLQPPRPWRSTPTGQGLIRRQKSRKESETRATSPRCRFCVRKKQRSEPMLHEDRTTPGRHTCPASAAPSEKPRYLLLFLCSFACSRLCSAGGKKPL
ncbi:hypothetical protein MRX96_059276 [Rhipicephalus microplus]